MLEDEERAIHGAAIPCVTQFPWGVSLSCFQNNLLNNEIEREISENFCNIN